jgi:hypothetical protein
MAVTADAKSVGLSTPAAVGAAVIVGATVALEVGLGRSTPVFYLPP